MNVGSSSFQGLTVEIQGNRVVYFLLYQLEQLFAALQIPYHPELLENVGSAQTLRPRLFQPALYVPNLSLQSHRTAQVVHAIGRV